MALKQGLVHRSLHTPLTVLLCTLFAISFLFFWHPWLQVASRAQSLTHIPHTSAHANDLHAGSPSELDVGGPQFELVISHFNRNFLRIKRWVDFIKRTPNVRALGMRVTIYTKNINTDLAQLKGVTKADHVEYLPNLGREGDTMLHHILTRYDTLSPLTMFMQDEPEWMDTKADTVKDWFRHALHAEFEANTGFLAMSSFLEACDCGTCNRGKFPLMIPIYQLARNEDCLKDRWYASLWSQFIVSRQRILAHDKAFYTYLRTMISAPDDNWVHEESQPAWILDQFLKGKSTQLNPLYGHTLERSWALIFACGPHGTTGDWKGECNVRQCHCRDYEMQDPTLDKQLAMKQTINDDLGLDALVDEEDLPLDPSESTHLSMNDYSRA